MLSPQQVLPFLTHPDFAVRAHAGNYFFHLADASPIETAGELWKAIDQFGDLPNEIAIKEQQRILNVLAVVPQDDASIDRAIELLKQSASDKDTLYSIHDIFVTMPIDLLEKRQGEILPIIQEELRGELEHRLSLRTLPAEQIWAQFVEAASTEQDSDDSDDSDDSNAHVETNLRDALANRAESSIPLAMAVMEDPGDRWLLECWSCELLGQIRHVPAIDLLIEKMEIEDEEYLREAAAEALGRMPAEQVVPKLEAAYASDDPFHRMAIAGVLGHVKHPLAEEALLRLLPAEKSHTALTGIGMALADLCTTDGLEPLRKIVIDGSYDIVMTDLKESVVTVSTMTGHTFAELDQWKQQLNDPAYKAKRRDSFLGSFGMDKRMVEQFHNYLAGKPLEDEPEEEPISASRSLAAPSTIRRTEPKIGRNDPCPCGSGKKYKKCCGK